MRVSQPTRETDKKEESRSEAEVHRSQEPGFSFQWRRGGKHIPRAEEAHLSVDVSRGPWSRTPGPLALVPEAAIILRPHKLFPTLQKKKADVRSLSHHKRGCHSNTNFCIAIQVLTDVYCHSDLQVSPWNFHIRMLCLPFVSLQTYPSVFTSHICWKQLSQVPPNS